MARFRTRVRTGPLSAACVTMSHQARQRRGWLLRAGSSGHGLDPGPQGGSVGGQGQDWPQEVEEFSSTAWKTRRPCPVTARGPAGRVLGGRADALCRRGPSEAHGVGARSSGGVAAPGGPPASPALVPAGVSHRDHDGEAGELRGLEGGRWRLPAAPPPPPLQLPVPAPHALGPHPPEGQGAIHVPVSRGLSPGRRAALRTALPGKTSVTASARSCDLSPACAGRPSCPPRCVPVSRPEPRRAGQCLTPAPGGDRGPSGGEDGPSQPAQHPGPSAPGHTWGLC